LKHVYSVADIVEENVVEGLTWPEYLSELVLVRESDCETKGWISLPRDVYYLGADVDAFAFAWPDGGQNIAGVASNR
jgi:hypothetical protein